MSAEKKRSSPSLSELLEKYRDSSVVAEIEKNIRLSSTLNLSLDSLEPHPLCSEADYDLNVGPLYRSIEQNGILFPLFVVPRQNKYSVINGVKRLLLSRRLGLKAVPAVAVALAEEETIAYILQNQIKNGDNAFIKGTAYKTLIDRFGYSEADVRLLTGLSHGQVNNLMRMLSLPKEVKQAVTGGRCTYAEARVLLGLAKSQQIELMEKIIREGLTVREAEKLAGSYKKTSCYHRASTKFSRDGLTLTVRLETPDEADRLEAVIAEFLKNR